MRKLLKDTKGAGTIEYALIAMLISVGAIAGYGQLGHKVQTHFAKLNQDIGQHL
jgi:Flp pilus assembly pilin Flp